jgi:hypothetical protein
MLDVTGEMEGGWNGGGVLGFSLRFDPMRTGFDPMRRLEWRRCQPPCFRADQPPP